ncbi:hypothetical protein JIN85_08525 [Luteolibacter pohnpeiensis]|uniref:Transferrin-binding protein B C-lobe/N-lobe beta barrel domain-containing protein n=1 Tax=Luteolibacter pohnpeiensis TaxID=454153 RepID=A0A934VUE7_9BACT|nr:hypothetical protein [Luteolibacter pohnpeiensis]MBK1882457.1 hypothetical protein [Luteolibacter pohnpeiensis]
MKFRSTWLLSLLGGFALILNSCTVSPTDYSGSPQNAIAPSHSEAEAKSIITGGLRSGDSAIQSDSIDAVLKNPNRPGLATGWGDSVHSNVVEQDFVRASKGPAGTDAIYYNDSDGMKAMTTRPESVKPLQRAAGGLVEWGIKGPHGFLPAYKEYGWGRRFVTGKKGSSYSIEIKNRSESTIEVVASVDGLDVMDGKTASYAKRGYLIGPHRTFTIDGFRTSDSSVASFQFSSVMGSYANQRYGNTRNVGVIGLAVFTSKHGDAQLRNNARAFAQAP